MAHKLKQEMETMKEEMNECIEEKAKELVEQTLNVELMHHLD